uniref:Uncharacterized protein n=1 Tax=Arundo donax TaxID=35708 RepID=A0A0A9EMK0_ARUDO
MANQDDRAPKTAAMAGSCEDSGMEKTKGNKPVQPGTGLQLGVL